MLTCVQSNLFPFLRQSLIRYDLAISQRKLHHVPIIFKKMIQEKFIAVCYFTSQKTAGNSSGYRTIFGARLVLRALRKRQCVHGVCVCVFMLCICM